MGSSLIPKWRTFEDRSLADIDKTFREGNLVEVAELLVNPARSGVYLTRTRLRRIGTEMGLRTGVQTRARMMESLFREAGSEGKVDELLTRLDAEAGRWIDRFRDWSKACPPAKAAWREWSSRAKHLRRQLRRARKWADQIEPAPSFNEP
jgi:hypothetical protein